MRTVNTVCLAMVLGFVGMAGSASAQQGAVALRGDNTSRSYTTTFDGDWNLKLLIVDGKPNEIPANTGFEIRQGQLVLVTRGKSYDMGSLETDSFNSGNVDVVSERGRERGLYFLNGETLTLCVAVPGEDRPADFASPGAGGTFIVLERI